MREIKFRGKNNEGSWHYGLLTFIFNRYAIAHVENENTVDLIEKESIGQYTGLLDKELNEIYEDDLLDVDYPNGTFLAKVVYELGSFHIVAVKGSIIDYFPKNWNDNVLGLTALHWEQDCTDGNAIDSVKIVGNIHENTSLLEAVE